MISALLCVSGLHTQLSSYSFVRRKAAAFQQTQFHRALFQMRYFPPVFTERQVINIIMTVVVIIISAFSDTRSIVRYKKPEHKVKINE